MGAASVRFLFACPFALAWLALLTLGFGLNLPTPSAAFVIWIITGSIAQITFTFLLMWLFSFSNFTVGTALSKTEVVQVVVLEAILLHELISGLATCAVVVATAGVLIMTAGKSKLSITSLVSGLRQKSTVIGLACGFFLGLSAVLFRGAALSLEGDSILATSAYTLAVATVLQSIMMFIWLIMVKPIAVSPEMVILLESNTSNGFHRPHARQAKVSTSVAMLTVGEVGMVSSSLPRFPSTPTETIRPAVPVMLNTTVEPSKA